MSLPDKIKAIVLTCDRWRAITRHLILKYERLWPDHPFIFHVPYQELRGTDTDRIKYHAAPEDIRGPSCIYSQISVMKNGFTGAWTTNTRFNFPPTRWRNLSRTRCVHLELTACCSADAGHY